ncbi:FAD:protein FMN transferase [Nibrella saemangeumensis]|uniref:FAD:protein FMN transferase n=1 Tax=Nibrella saemangeumensis TaxID=1084526 RepID=A0ABP8NDP0_9BACT
MPLPLRVFVLISFLFILGACRFNRRSYTELEGQAQGTTFRIVYLDPQDRDFSQSVDSLFRVIDRSMSLWDSNSVISRLNRNEPAAKADTHFGVVYEQAYSVSQATDGAFDATVGPLVKAWGFSFKKGLPSPTAREVDSLRQLIGYQKVKLAGDILTKANPRMELDFNALAQGYTVDVIAEFLHKRGVRNYLVEIGGEVRTLGTNERRLPWQVGIDKPLDTPTEGRPLQTVVPLSGRSLATSGSYRKFVVRDGKKYSHAIDPKTGYPITHNLLSVSVIAEDCITADAYATAFLVMGLEKAVPLAMAKGMELYGVYSDSTGKFQVQTTPGFVK